VFEVLLSPSILHFPFPFIAFRSFDSRSLRSCATRVNN
jgi:hypothetical protein